MAQLQKEIIRFTGVSGVFIALSRIAGYARDKCLAHFLGTGAVSDAFFLAYRIPNLLRRLTAEGAMTAAFVPVFTRLKDVKPERELWEFASKFFFTLILVIAVLAALGSLGARPVLLVCGRGFQDVPGQFELATLLLRVMFPYIAIVSGAAVLQGILNSLKVFGIPAATTIFFNLSVILCLVALSLSARSGSASLENYALAASVGVLLGGLCQLAIQMPPALKRGMRFAPKLGFGHPAVREVGLKMLPGMTGAGVLQIKALIGNRIATHLYEGSVSSLFFAERLMELTLGIFTISLATVILPFMSKSAVNKDFAEFKSTFAFATRQVVFVILPASAGLTLLARPAVKLLFQGGKFSSLSLEYTVAALCAYTLGMLGFSMVRIASQAFYSVQDVVTPVKVAGLTVALAVALMLILIGPLGHAGIALGTSVAGYFNAVVLFAALRRRFGPLGMLAARRSLATTIAATLAMTGTVLVLQRAIGLERCESTLQLAAGLFVIIVAGLSVYLAVARLARSEELPFYARLLHRKDHEPDKRS